MLELLQQTARSLENLNPDQFELYYEKRSQLSIDSKDLKTDTVSRSEDVGLSIRVIKDGRSGFSFTTSLEPAAIARAIQTAASVAQVMPEDAFVGFQSFASYVYSEMDAVDPKGLSLPLAQKAELARELENLTRKADKRIAGVRSATYSETLLERALLDSSSEAIQYRKTVFSASVTCKAEGHGDSQMGSDFAFANDFESLKLGPIATNAAHYATELLGAKAAPTMKCPAIFRNSVVAELIEFLASSFSAEAVDKGRSMLAGKQGQRVFSEAITLLDDGMLAGGYATAPFDGEGVPAQKTTLVDGGFLSSFLYDTYYAKKFKAKSTGNAARSIKSAPSISTSNLYIPAGRKTPDNLMTDLKRGILITDLMGVHTANSVTGDFSLGASGILIENGKLTTPVRGFAVAGNVLELFRKVADTGSDLKFFGSVGAPSLRVQEISVGGSSS